MLAIMVTRVNPLPNGEYKLEAFDSNEYQGISIGHQKNAFTLDPATATIKSIFYGSSKAFVNSISVENQYLSLEITRKTENSNFLKQLSKKYKRNSFQTVEIINVL